MNKSTWESTVKPVVVLSVIVEACIIHKPHIRF